MTKRNNKYTCIDIEEANIKYSKQRCEYVDFYLKDICDFTEKELKKFDLILLVQSYIQITNIHLVFKKYFKANPNGCIMMVNTIFPTLLSGIANISKTHLFPIMFNNCFSGNALTIEQIDDLGHYLKRKIININICKSLSGFDEYLTIIR